MLVNKIEKIKEKWKKEGRLKTLSVEDAYSITKRIDDEMSIVRMDYRRREAQSIIESEKYILIADYFPISFNFLRTSSNSVFFAGTFLTGTLA